MKSLLFAIILLFIGFTSFEQTITFNRLYTSYQGTTSVFSILTQGKQYYCLFGQLDTINPNGYQQMGIIKLDSAFNVIDSNLFDSGKVLVAMYGKGFALENKDTTFIFSGCILFYGTNTVKANGYIAKIDKNLDTLWTRQISHPDTAYADTAATPWVVLMDAVVDAEGNYLISGNYNYHCQGDYKRSFMLKLDPMGNIIWQKLLDPSIVPYIRNIEYDPIDSGFYFISRINEIAKIKKMSKNCTLLWEANFINQQHPSVLGDLKMINENEIIIAIAFFKEPLIPQSFGLLSVSKVNTQNHTLIWEKTFPSISVYSQYMDGETVTITKTPSNNIAIGTVGKRIDGEGEFYSDYRAYLLLLNQNGDSLWSHYYTYQNDSFDVEDMQFADMVVCPDGGFLFGGSYYNFPNDPMYLKAWLVKTDSLGNAPGMFTVGIEEEELVIKNLELKMYPNPTSDNINLSMQENPKEELQLELYNISGQLVMQRRLPAFEKEHRVDIQHLQSGVYLVKLMSENEVVYNGKIIKK